MRIDELTLCNFKAFKELTIPFARASDSPERNGSFHLLIGENGAGKTSTLEGLAVAVGSWFLGIRGYGTRNIQPDDVRVSIQEFGDTLRMERQYPVTVVARGRVITSEMTWIRSLDSEGGRTVGAQEIRTIAQLYSVVASEGVLPVTLPLISFYGAGRPPNSRCTPRCSNSRPG